MRNKKQLTGLLLSVTAFAGILAGCSKVEGNSPPSAKSAESGAVSSEKEEDGDPAEEFISLGTSSSGGTFNTLGVALCQVWNEKIPSTSFSAEVTAGSSENCLRVGTEELQMAFSAASSVYEAATGTGQFEGKKVEGIRVIANLYPAIIQLPALKSSGINTINDIKGKKVNVGEAGSGSESQALNILKSYGISTDDFNIQQLSHSNASDAVVDEKMDGYIISGSLGQSHQMKAMSSGKCMLASMGTEKDIEKVISDFPYYYAYTIPADTYPNQSEDVKTIATGTLLIVNETISEELVYQMTKSIFENIQALAQSQDIANEISLETALNVSGIQLHPGAERYYREAGILK